MVAATSPPHGQRCDDGESDAEWASSTSLSGSMRGTWTRMTNWPSFSNSSLRIPISVEMSVQPSNRSNGNQLDIQAGQSRSMYDFLSSDVASSFRWDRVGWSVASDQGPSRTRTLVKVSVQTDVVTPSEAQASAADSPTAGSRGRSTLRLSRARAVTGIARPMKAAIPIPLVRRWGRSFGELADGCSIVCMLPLFSLGIGNVGGGESPGGARTSIVTEVVETRTSVRP